MHCYFPFHANCLFGLNNDILGSCFLTINLTQTPHAKKITKENVTIEATL